MKQLFYSSHLGSSLIPTLAASLQALRPGETLINEGDDCSGGHWRIKKGVLKLKRAYRTGLFLETLIGSGEELIFSASHGRSEFQIQAASDVVVEAIASSNKALASVSTKLTPQFRMNPSNTDLDLFAPFQSALKRPVELMPVRSRVAAVVWALGRRFGHYKTHSVEGGQERTGSVPAAGQAASQVIEINLDLTREEIGHLAGTVYESVIRSLTSLKKDGILDLEGRSISILREDQLARVGQIVLGSSPQDPAFEDGSFEKPTGKIGEQNLGEQIDLIQNHSSKINSSSKEAG